MKRIPMLAAALLILIAGSIVSPFASGSTAGTPGKPPTPTQLRCQSISIGAPSGARIESIDARRNAGGTLTFPIQPGYPAAPPPVDDVPAFCQVVVTLTHGRAGDHERVEVWLPETGWTGRFQALGGAGYSAGDFGPNLANAVKSGYAVGSQDAAATPVTGWTSPWALTADGRVNRPVLENFAERGAHELALVGKSLVRAYYGRSATYSYWNGCSTGGRQGYLEAQRHPHDFDGILAAAPAISWDRFAVAALWPWVVMNTEDDILSSCKLKAFNAAAVATCDPLDGVIDGIIGDPVHCTFDPRTLIGTTVDCDGVPATITATDAEVVRRIWDGPRTPSGRKLWYGIPKGADFAGLADSMPFPVAASWVQDFVAKDRSLDLSAVDYADYTRYFARSVQQYHHIIGSDQADLSAFHRSGGKLLSWQGLADQLVPVEGTIRYYDRVAARTPGSVVDFYRLFLAPGAAHCAGGVGPNPTDPLAALVTWVERGTAPTVLPAATTTPDGTVIRRNLCPYPSVQTYRGHGDPNVPSSFRCAPTRHR